MRNCCLVELRCGNFTLIERSVFLLLTQNKTCNARFCPCSATLLSGPYLLFYCLFSYCLILYGTIRYKNIFEIFCWGKLFPSPKSVYFVLHKLGGYFMLFIFAWGSYFIPWSCLLSFLSLTVHQSPLCVHGNRILCIHTKHFQEVPRSLPVCRVGVLCVQLSLS